MKSFMQCNIIAQEHRRPIDATNNRKVVHGRLNQFKEEEDGEF